MSIPKPLRNRRIANDTTISLDLENSVALYYDGRVASKVQDFVDGNQRVDRAWITIREWGPPLPKTIIEIGCGIGTICWRLKQRWPDARVVGVDISYKSLEIAKQLFELPGLSFVQGPMTNTLLPDKCDLLVLMDVYEHVSISDRPTFHDALKHVLNRFGRIILSFPTPRHLAWLRTHNPGEIQPVDEDINVETMLSLAKDLGIDVLLYQEVSVWHQGDYAHSVLGTNDQLLSVESSPSSQGLTQRIVKKFARQMKRRSSDLITSREDRLSLVKERLGPSYRLE
jgi:trans-aconitate methyltransferase